MKLPPKKYLIVIVITAFIVPIATFTIRDYFESKMTNRQLYQIAESINQKVPLLINEQRRIDSCSLTSKKEISYFYTLPKLVKENIELNQLSDLKNAIA